MIIQRLSRAAILGAVLTMLVGVGVSLGHGEIESGEHTIEMGFANEPVFTGQKSGLEFSVFHGEEPIEGLEDTLDATVTFGDQTRDLVISPRFGEPGWYQSYFFPTVAGKYTFHITGTMPDGTAIDETFTSAPDGFNEVQDAVAGQFPVRFPSTPELAAEAQRGADAASQLPIALGLGGLALLIALAALGLALAGRSRSARG